MTTMRRLRVTWNGLGGLPGLSTFYYGVASPNVSDAVTFFSALASQFPTGLSWDIPSSGDELDDATGTLLGGWAGSGGGQVAASGGAGSYAAGTGYRIAWNTGVVAAGRRVRGATFMCPVITSVYDSQGTIAAAYLANAQTAANAFVSSGVAKGIWHRPHAGAPGLYAAMSSALIPDKVSSLRSRRS